MYLAIVGTMEGSLEMSAVFGDSPGLEREESGESSSDDTVGCI